MKFVVEKGIPMPGIMLTMRPRLRYPFGSMDVGDSFFVADYSELNRVHAAVGHQKVRHNRKFATRMEGTGFRVWRVQ